MDTNMTYDEIVTASEEAIRNTTEKRYYFPDSFNYKINDDFLLALTMSTKNAKEISVVYWFLKTMNKANIVHNVVVKHLYTKANISKVVFYRLLTRLIEQGLIIKLDTKTYMINPEMVINHRKSINKDRPQLLALWAEYQQQQKG